MSSAKPKVECARNSRPRVLIVVSGGVAEFVADDGVDVAIFDWDDYESDPSVTSKPPRHFEDLAVRCDIPVMIGNDMERP